MNTDEYLLRSRWALRSQISCRAVDCSLSFSFHFTSCMRYLSYKQYQQWWPLEDLWFLFTERSNLLPDKKLGKVSVTELLVFWFNYVHERKANESVQFKILYTTRLTGKRICFHSMSRTNGILLTIQQLQELLAKTLAVTKSFKWHTSMLISSNNKYLYIINYLFWRLCSPVMLEFLEVLTWKLEWFSIYTKSMVCFDIAFPESVPEWIFTCGSFDTVMPWNCVLCDCNWREKVNFSVMTQFSAYLGLFLMLRFRKVKLIIF